MNIPIYLMIHQKVLKVGSNISTLFQRSLLFIRHHDIFQK